MERNTLQMASFLIIFLMASYYTPRMEVKAREMAGQVSPQVVTGSLVHGIACRINADCYYLCPRSSKTQIQDPATHPQQPATTTRPTLRRRRGSNRCCLLQRSVVSHATVVVVDVRLWKGGSRATVFATIAATVAVVIARPVTFFLQGQTGFVFGEAGFSSDETFLWWRGN
ncbi:hypothetical protein Tsubulata_049753 [Turnera subulata]|uniref:Uncharacterized protein n=1 Tax=Turnera subulata TaxID=218843 RepID=A0A9Q0FTT9_9ROSI|nr:hypothetical protein Tsubulata_049753 [Turnera subulata]